MVMKKIIILLSFILIFTSCVTQQRCNRKFPPETMIIRKDSIIRETKTIFRDTTITIHIPGETKFQTDTVYIKSGVVYFKPSYLKTALAESHAYIQNNRLKHTLTQNDTIIRQRVDNAIRETWERAGRYFKGDEIRIVERKHIPLLFKILSAIGLAALIYLAFKIRKILKL